MLGIADETMRGDLIAVLEMLNQLTLTELTDPDCVATLIRTAGLVQDTRLLYGIDNRYMNSSLGGLWQIPSQLAASLVYLSRFELGKIVEIGTFTGWTISFIATYFKRFNPGLQVTTIDTGSGFRLRKAVAELCDIRVLRGTSDMVAGEHFDLAFIDADHSYHACSADYKNVGEHATVCMFHDINDRDVIAYEPNAGGVPRFWKELSATVREPDHIAEFLEHSAGVNVMGIGLLVRGTAKPRLSIAES